MTYAKTIIAGPVKSSIVFFRDPEDGSTPYNFVYEPPAGEPRRNYGEENQIVSIEDIRGNETDFSLDSSGFTVHSKVPSSVKYDDWGDDELVKQKYYPEVESLLLSKVPGAKRVVLFDHTIRRTGPNAHREPVTRAHIDQTVKSAEERVRLHLPEDEAEQLVAGRYRIINVWRPLQGPVKAFPLAMADSRSVKDADLVPVEHRYPNRTGETAGVRFNTGQKWFYFSEMSEGERIFLQCFDSAGSHARVAHTAFVDPRSPAGAGRESIEVRALVFG